MPWLPERQMPNYAPRGVVQPSGLHTGSGGRDQHVPPTSAGLTRDPKEANSLFTSWFGNHCASSTGFEKSTRVGWDGMLHQKAQKRTMPACLHKGQHKALKPWEDRLERCALEICCPTWKTDAFQSHKNRLNGRFVTMLSFCFWIGAGEKKILFWQRE